MSSVTYIDFHPDGTIMMMSELECQQCHFPNSSLENFKMSMHIMNKKEVCVKLYHRSILFDSKNSSNRILC